jgi:hypothetical protein
MADKFSGRFWSISEYSEEKNDARGLCCSNANLVHAESRGVPREKMAGSWVKADLNFSDIDQWINSLRQLSEDKPVIIEENVLSLPNGDFIYVSAKLYYLGKTKDGNTMYAGFADDITDAHKLEAELEKKRLHIEAMSQKLTMMTVRCAQDCIGDSIARL